MNKIAVLGFGFLALSAGAALAENKWTNDSCAGAGGSYVNIKEWGGWGCIMKRAQPVGPAVDVVSQDRNGPFYRYENRKVGKLVVVVPPRPTPQARAVSR